MRRFLHLSSYRLAAIALLAGLPAWPATANDVVTMELADETEVEIRVFAADGDVLILGFACDEGGSDNEESTAAKLADDGVEVWMPDLLSAYWLPDLPSSLKQIPASAMVELADEAHRVSGKEVYLMAGGIDAELVLRGLAEFESGDPAAEFIKGGIMLFPRLLEGEPEPGREPVYIGAVGATRSPLLVIEGGRTPNRWGLPHLVEALARGGSTVQSLVVPDVRGYFYSRADANVPEGVVTSQLHGLIKASLYRLRHEQ